MAETKRVIVTGATGLIGSHLCHAFFNARVCTPGSAISLVMLSFYTSH